MEVSEKNFIAPQFSNITVQVIRIREAFKTLQTYYIDCKIVPDIEMNFEEAFKSIADNLDLIIVKIDELDKATGD